MTKALWVAMVGALVYIPCQMRTIVLASGNAVALQAPTMISNVATSLKTIPAGDTSYRIFEYEDIHISNDLPLQQYREAVAIVKPQLQSSEHIIQLDVGHVPGHPLYDGDLLVMTCSERCVPDSGSGRTFVLKRVNGVLTILSIYTWIA